MANITSTPTASSLTVSGNTQVSGTISWTKPEVPSGVTISSCVLTGTATASMSKGSATITVNGTKVTSGSQFTINLGTSNNTTSVTTTAKGGNKNANGTVSFSNLVYTVTYETSKPTYTVTFKDWDGTVLKTQTVEEGSSATAPTDPIRNGYIFTGWNVSFSNVTSDLTVIAQYEANNIKMLVAKYTTNAAGVVPTFNSGYVYELTETENNGIYTVEITSDSDFSSINFASKTKLLTVEYLKITNAVTSTYQMFYGCTSLTSINGMADWDTSNVTNMEGIFRNCNQLTTIDVSGFDTTNVTNMTWMFYNCNNLTSLDLSNFNTSNVTSMCSMFYSCNQLTTIDVSNFDTTNVTDMTWMFYNCNNLTSLDLSNFNTSNVTDMYSMFYNCNQLTTIDLSNFDTTNVTDMTWMFYNCNNLTSISMNNSDYNSVNKIITQLPTRTSESPGTLNITGIDDMSQVDVTAAQAKYWNVVQEESGEADDNELVQGDILEDGSFNDDVTNVVRTKFIDVSDKKSIKVTVLTDNVYVSACYLYNANKELVKVIDLSSDKKRMFGVNLQELIKQVLEDEEGDN